MLPDKNGNNLQITKFIKFWKMVQKFIGDVSIAYVLVSTTKRKIYFHLKYTVS